MTFDDFGLQPGILKQLAAQGLTEPTPIQAKAIPIALQGRDVMGLAQTGTGKTAAFGLPLLNALISAGTPPMAKSATGLVLAPTRELAKQISEALAGFTRGGHLKVVVVVGGVSMNRQINAMRKGADLLIATPGRLMDHVEQKTIRLDQTRFLVLDEADQMLDMGFIHALRKIAPLLPRERQTMMFSATMPKLMADLSKQFLTDPTRVEVARPGVAADKITQSVHFVGQPAKTGLLTRLLGEHVGERAVVFARTKHGSERLMKKLVQAGFAAASIHGNKSQGQRDRALAGFKSGEVTVLVATDVAARGIDIPDVKYVYNFDLPNVAENYIHRIGRTARAGASGQAVAFCSPEELSEFRAIEKVLKTTIPVAGGVVPEPASRPARQGRKPGGKPGGHSGGKPAANAGGKARSRPRRGRRRGKGAKQAA
ncbi:MAG: DEAD/DEAH box helicase [Pseudomonadota bacterium]